MKRLLYIVGIISLAVSCSKQSEPMMVNESLQVQSPASTRVSLSDGINAVWNKGDKVSVFYEGGANEMWEYTGEDGARKGTISHEGQTNRVGLGSFTALWPYDSGASISGTVVSTTVPATQQSTPASYSWAMLLSTTTDNSLSFQYANTFVRLGLKGAGSIKSLELKGNDNETLSGECNVDVSGPVPEASFTSGASGKSVTISNGDSVLSNITDAETDFWIATLPGTFEKGLTITVTMASGGTEDVTISGPISLKAGEVLCVHASLLGYETITLDFVNNAGAFSPILPPTSGLSTSEGTHTFTCASGKYSLTFHPAYDSNWYGYGYYDHADYGRSLLLGRKGAWIKLPVISGSALCEVEYVAGSTSGYPFISDDSSDPFNHMVSNQINATVGYTSYIMTVEQPVKNKQYYLVVGSGNLLMKSMTLRYTADN